MANKQQKSYPVRLEPELEAWLKAEAEEGDRSLNAQINRALRELKEVQAKEIESTNPQPNEVSK